MFCAAADLAKVQRGQLPPIFPKEVLPIILEIFNFFPSEMFLRAPKQSIMISLLNLSTVQQIKESIR